MMFQIKEAELIHGIGYFRAVIDQFVTAMNEYEAHLKGVAADAANPDLKPEDRRVAFPPPECPCPQAVRKDGDTWVADYEIVGPSLAERKAAFSADVRQREGLLIAGVIPAAKQRHWQFREQDIRAADHMRVSNHVTRIEPDQIDAFLRAARPSDDTAFLEEMKARHETVAAIQRWAAKVEHDIDDLTEETIDGFEVPAFHG